MLMQRAFVSCAIADYARLWPSTKTSPPPASSRSRATVKTIGDLPCSPSDFVTVTNCMVGAVGAGAAGASPPGCQSGLADGLLAHSTWLIVHVATWTPGTCRVAPRSVGDDGPFPIGGTYFVPIQPAVRFTDKRHYVKLTAAYCIR